MSEEECGWEEVYRAYGCSPLYLDDRKPGDSRAGQRLELHELPPLLEVVRLEPHQESPQQEELPVPVV